MKASIANVLILLAYTMTLVQAAVMIATAHTTHFLELYLVLTALVLLAIYDFYSHGKPDAPKSSLSSILDLALLWTVAMAATTDLMSKDHYGHNFDILLCLSFIVYSTHHILFKGRSAEYPTLLLILCISNPIGQPRVFTPYNLDLLLAAYLFVRYGKLGGLRVSTLIFPAYLLAGALFFYNRTLGFEYFCRWAGPLMILAAVAETCRREKSTEIAEKAVIWAWLYVILRFSFEYAYRFSLFGIAATAAIRITVNMVQVIGVLPYLLPGLFLAFRRFRRLSAVQGVSSVSIPREPGSLPVNAEKAILVAGIGSSIVFLLIGGGRASLMGMGVGIVILGAMHMIASGTLDSRKAVAGLGFCAIAATGLAFFYGQRLLEAGEGSMAARIFMYRAAPGIMSEAPILGHGPYSRPNRMFRLVSNSTEPVETTFKIQQGMTVHPHNTFLHISEDTGLAGLTLAGIMFFTILSPGRVMRHLTREASLLVDSPCATILLTLFALVPVVMLDSIIATKGYLTLLAVLLAILMTAVERESPVDPSRGGNYSKLAENILFISLFSASIGWMLVSCPADFFKRYAELDERRGNLVGMRINLSMALEFDPYNFNVLNKLGDLCIDLKDLDAAQVNFKQSLDLCRTQYYPYLRLGDLAFLGRRFDEAARNYTQAIEFGLQKRGIALLCRAIARREAGKRQEYLNDLVMLCRYLPDAIGDPEIIDSGAAESLSELLTASIPSEGPADDSIGRIEARNICMSMYNLGMADWLAKHLSILMKKYPEEATFANLMANILQVRYGPDAVNQLYSNIGTLTVEHLNHFGKILYSLKKMNDSREIFLAAIDANRVRLFDGFDLEAYEFLARIAEHFKDTDETLKNLQRLLFFRPTDHRLYIKVADTLYSMGNEFSEAARDNYTLALGEVYDLNVFRPSKRNIPLFFSRREENMKRMLEDIDAIKKELEHCNDRINVINRKLGIDS